MQVIWNASKIRHQSRLLVLTDTVVLIDIVSVSTRTLDCFTAKARFENMIILGMCVTNLDLVQLLITE